MAFCFNCLAVISPDDCYLKKLPWHHKAAQHQLAGSCKQVFYALTRLYYYYSRHLKSCSVWVHTKHILNFYCSRSTCLCTNLHEPCSLLQNNKTWLLQHQSRGISELLVENVTWFEESCDELTINIRYSIDIWQYWVNFSANSFMKLTVLNYVICFISSL
jgi:hypothetical protein